MNYLGKSEFVSLVSPTLLSKMFVAKILRKFYPAIISGRLAALDNSLVLQKFRVRRMPVIFEYSAYNLNNHGICCEQKALNSKDKAMLLAIRAMCAIKQQAA